MAKEKIKRFKISFFSYEKIGFQLHCVIMTQQDTLIIQKTSLTFEEI
jgi:hypothetical protein